MNFCRFIFKNFAREKLNTIAIEFAQKILCIRSEMKSINGKIVWFCCGSGSGGCNGDVAYALENRFKENNYENLHWFLASKIQWVLLIWISQYVLLEFGSISVWFGSVRFWSFLSGKSYVIIHRWWWVISPYAYKYTYGEDTAMQSSAYQPWTPYRTSCLRCTLQHCSVWSDFK